MRYHIHNRTRTYFVEYCHDEEGLEQARALRRLNHNFKYQRIKEVLQAYPYNIITGVPYKYT